MWTTGFGMALYNTRIVRRSNALLDYAYGRRFRYAEHLSVGSSVLAPVLSAVASAANNGAVALGSRFFRLLPRRLEAERVLTAALGAPVSVAGKTTGANFTVAAGGVYPTTLALTGGISFNP